MKNLIDSYYDWLKEDTCYEKLGEYTKVSTPFLDRHNDCIEFYMKYNKDGTIYITDDGYILNDLISCGVKLDNKEQTKLLNNFLHSYNIKLEDGNCLTMTTRSNNLPSKINGYIQGLLTVNNFYYLYTATRNSFVDGSKFPYFCKKLEIPQQCNVFCYPDEYTFAIMQKPNFTNLNAKNSDKELGVSKQGL